MITGNIVINWGVRYQRNDNGYDSTDWYGENGVAAKQAYEAAGKYDTDPNMHVQLILKVIVREK